MGDGSMCHYCRKYECVCADEPVSAKAVKAFAVHCLSADTLWDTTFPTEQRAVEAIDKLVKSRRHGSWPTVRSDYEVIHVEIRQVSELKPAKK